MSGQTADCETLTVYPAERFSGDVTGSWTRASDEKTIILATDISWGGSAETGPDGATQYRDTSWSGSVSADWVVREGPDGVRLIGEYEGFDPPYYYSLERTVEPPVDYLTGDASSLSLDWFDAPAGIPVPVIGSATIIQDGSQLSIVDYSGDGDVYEIQAEWTGYEYEGGWWPQSDPSQTSPWRGQLNASGVYLHGTWEKGEYSFLMAPIGGDDSIAQVPAGTAVVSYDSFDDTFATIQDPQTDYRYVLSRSQDRIRQIRVVTPAGGVIVVDVDDRMRPTRSWADVDGDGWEDEVLSFQWSADSETLHVIDEITLVENTIVLDWSDAAVLLMIDITELQSGQDLTDYRQWITENPGRLSSISRGDEVLGSLLPRVMGTRLIKDNHPAPWGGIRDSIVTGLALYSLFKMGILASGALAASPYALALAFGALYVVALFLVVMFVWFVFICDPCTLSCFWNCTAN